MSDDDSADDQPNPFAGIEDPAEDDPFERIDPEERGTDPFESLEDERTAGDRMTEGEPPESPDESPTGQAPSPGELAETADGEQTDRFDEYGFSSESAGPPVGTGAGSAGDQQGPEESGDPFDQLGRDRREDDPFEHLGERADDTPEEADGEIWESLSRDQFEPETERRGQRRFAEMSKHSYCERCEFFSEPPDIDCSNEGTDIIEFVDSETVRVADCPIVAEREELADLEADR